MPDIETTSDSDSVHVLEGSTFMLSDSHGDVNEGTIGGLFHDDTRFISQYELYINGEKPVLLTSNQVDYYSAGFFMTNTGDESIPANALSIQRHRFVGNGLHDDVIIHNHTDTDVHAQVRLKFNADFADIFEVKNGVVKKQGILSTAHNIALGKLIFEYEHGIFKVKSIVRMSQEFTVEDNDAVFHVVVPKKKTWRTCVIIHLHNNEHELLPMYSCGDFATTEKKALKNLELWNQEVPRLHSHNENLTHIYKQSVADLASLRLRETVNGTEWSLPAAGLPWFMTVFGRDTLVTAYQSLWVGSDLARGALTALAALQGNKSDDFHDEDPGKIIHEIRYGELTTLGQKPQQPYYGSIDATPLWLILLSEYWRFTQDSELCMKFKDNAYRALKWIDTHGDLDQDGYVEYKTRSTQGLGNQGWKDSGDGVRFHDGRIAQAPIALCEVQGYVYDAKKRMAEMVEALWNDTDYASRLRKEADALYDRFNNDFWVSEHGGYYAIALDANKTRVNARTSNMGHLLWSGIVPVDRAAHIVKHLMSADMFSGWGIRTTALDDGGYNPIAYHNGTVWPHDNSLICAGLAAYGYHEEATKIVENILEASAFTHYQLPEVFAGYPRSETRFPVKYPTACSPQAWATAAPLLFIRTLFGMDVHDGRLTCAPHIPHNMGRVTLQGVRFGERTFTVWGEGDEGGVINE